MNQVIQEFAGALLSRVQEKMFGVDEITRLSLVSFFTGGHLLLEGNPGLGKTELVKTLAEVLHFPFGRIQFTPDLMPADITGTYMPDFASGDNRRFSFRHGPIFTSLLLADEINRATPKTQSAMLEAMAERQVTVLGEIRKLKEPFMVLATQNPIDQEGTYNLPEAQADRFMFKIAMPTPAMDTMRLILKKQTGALGTKKKAGPGNPVPQTTALFKDREDALEKYRELKSQIQEVPPLPSVETHLLNLYLASNGRYGELEGLETKQVDRLKRLVGEFVVYGLGPRAPIAMMLGAKAWSLLFSRFSGYAEGPSLAAVVIPVLRHRLKLDLDWNERYESLVSVPGSHETWRLEKFLADLFISAAPKSGEYQSTVKNAFAMRPYVKGERW